MSVETSGDTQAMMANPKFQKLVRTRGAIGWTLAVIMLIAYFGFILLVAFNKADPKSWFDTFFHRFVPAGLLSQKIGGGTTSLAIVVGMALLVFTFLITALYVIIANSSFDKLTREIRAEVGK